MVGASLVYAFRWHYDAMICLGWLPHCVVSDRKLDECDVANVT